MAAPGTPQPEESPQAKARNQATQTHRGDGAYATRGRAARPGRGGWRHPDRPPEHPRPRELRRCAPEAVDLGAPDRPRHRWSREEGGGRRCGGVLAATASEEDICPLLVRTVEGSRLADDGYGMFYEGEEGPTGVCEWRSLAWTWCTGNARRCIGDGIGGPMRQGFEVPRCTHTRCGMVRSGGGEDTNGSGEASPLSTPDDCGDHASRPVPVTDKLITVMLAQPVSHTRKCSRGLVASSTRSAGVFFFYLFVGGGTRWPRCACTCRRLGIGSCGCIEPGRLFRCPKVDSPLLPRFPFPRPQPHHTNTK